MTVADLSKKRRLQALGIRTARTPENLTAVRDLTEQGWSAREIAAHLDIAPGTVARIRAEIGCPGWLKGDATQEVDEVAVMRATSGDRSVTLNTAERREAVAQLTARGLSARAIAELLGVAERTVNRHRAHRKDHAA